jgi:hypothetical protein
MTGFKYLAMVSNDRSCQQDNATLDFIKDGNFLAGSAFHDGARSAVLTAWEKKRVRTEKQKLNHLITFRNFGSLTHIAADILKTFPENITFRSKKETS